VECRLVPVLGTNSRARGGWLNAITHVLKGAARSVWFRTGTTRRCIAGPYAGIRFEISPAMYNRMGVFVRAYEPEVTRLLELVVRPGMIVYDVGAHVGIHTLYISRLLAGSGQVFAFEAWPANLGSLVRNVERNPELAANVRPVPLAVSDGTGLTTFAQGATDGKHHLCATGEKPDATVGTTTLDDFWAAGNPAPSVVKIDVEGWEEAALIGAETLIREVRPAFILEHHGRAAVLAGLLQAAGYETCDVGTRHVFASCANEHFGAVSELAAATSASHSRS
jgi:FkbM family methyltransferase